MKIVSDKNIPLAEYLFSSIGEVTLLAGRDISVNDLDDADLLLVRTITSVNKELLEGSKVKFVASATSGIDHIDTDYLKENNIGFAHAPGCNSRSVAEYVLSSMLIIAEQNDFSLKNATVGIIGCGHVGSLVRKFMQALDVKCLVNDPPLQEFSVNEQFCELTDFKQADIITIHTPLTEFGPYKTRYMVDDEFLGMLKPDAILINTARGQIIDEKALIAHQLNNDKFKLVLDVWENEPSINMDLLKMVSIGTPHIAGYSLDAKLRATQMIYMQACNFFDSIYDESLCRVHYPETESEISISEQVDDVDVIQLAVLTCHDVRSDSASLRREFEFNADNRATFFEELRKSYATRREFPSMTINIPKKHASIGEVLLSLGFKTVIH